MDEKTPGVEEFAAFLRSLRAALDVSQTALAKHGGPSETTVVEAESGRAWPRWATIRKIQVAYERLRHHDAGGDVAALFRLLAPAESFDGGITGRVERAGDAPRYSTENGLTIFGAMSDRGPVAGEDGLTVTRIATDQLPRLPWTNPAWTSFVEDARSNAAFTFIAHTHTMVKLFGPMSRSDTYFRTSPPKDVESGHRVVAIDPTWDLVSTENAKIALESLLDPRRELLDAADVWAPLMLVTAGRLAREAVKQRARAQEMADLASGGKSSPMPDVPGPLSHLFSGNSVAMNLAQTLTDSSLMASAPSPEELDRARNQIRDAYRDIVESMIGQISLSVIGDPEYASTAVRRIEDLEGTIWTFARSMASARAIASAAHSHPGLEKRKGLLVSEDEVAVGMWEGSPSYSEPALLDVQAVEGFDDVFLGTRRGVRMAFRL